MSQPAVDIERLRQVLGDPELAWVLDRLRTRLERGRPLRGTIALRRPTAGQREAVDRLLGRGPSRGVTVQLDLGRLEQVLRHAELASCLEQAVVALAGPIVDQRAQAAEAQRRWERVVDRARRRLAGRPRVATWLDDVVATGLLRRLSGDDASIAEALLDQAVGVVESLPGRWIPLPVLAAETTGDAHGLDHDRPLGRLVIRAAAALGDSSGLETARDRRETWASVGVTCDELSATALALNLPELSGRPGADDEEPGEGGDGLLAETARMHARQGEPLRLTLGCLVRHAPSSVPALTGVKVFVCENPSVVAAAAFTYGPECAPLVCTEGQPSTAVTLLLDRLVAAGAELLYHGDLDWPGLRIANLMVRRLCARPWRLRAADYMAQVSRLSRLERAGPRSAGARPVQLEGSPVEAEWDPELTAAMIRHQMAIHEEHVLDELLGDLGQQAAGGRGGPGPRCR